MNLRSENLARMCEIVSLGKDGDTAQALAAIKVEFRRIYSPPT